jgi:hypothetical protein
MAGMTSSASARGRAELAWGPAFRREGFVGQPTVIDARCILDADPWTAAGWVVCVPGRPQSG